MTLVSDHVSTIFASPEIVLVQKFAVFPLPHLEDLALVPSHFHNQYVWASSSPMRIDVNYSPSECAEGFPCPRVIHGLRAVGETYYRHRRSAMLSRGAGLARAYNRFQDPREASADIAKLRDLHVEMDRAVADAYGWAGLDLGHDFHQTRQGLRFTIGEEARREVLGRLLLLNHERYEEEVRQGLHNRGKGASARRREAAAASMRPLFSVEAS